MRALLVDDSRSILAYLRSLLAPCADLETECFLDPVAALARASEQRFDLAIVDNVMPGLDGLALIARMRKTLHHSQIPIVMLTGSDEDAVKIRALEVGVTDFLSKAKSRLELSIRLRNVVDLARALRKLEDHVASQAQEIEAATEALLRREEEMVFRLSMALEYRDNDTNDHTYRVAAYSRLIAERLGMSPREQRAIFIAAPLHDIGKVAIPDRILLKPGKLDADERKVIETHSAVGARILSGSRSELIALAATIAGCHHERWNGRGYPNGLAREAIPLAARIVAVADVFDALTTARPYKRAMPLEEAVVQLTQERGGHFDPACVDAFVAAIVELSGDPPSIETLWREIEQARKDAGLNQAKTLRLAAAS